MLRVLIFVAIFTSLDVLTRCNALLVKTLLKDLAKNAPTGMPPNCDPLCQYYYSHRNSGQRGKMYYQHGRK
uniref:Hypotheticial protein n=1 Tax=Schistosoma japonicum TaxID=6182 RepID=C7TXS9_SCHJA|nr:hypotheticial protein [Schistosoma japonicum]